VALEMGTEGRLGGQVQVKDAAGVWKELTDNFNTMAVQLTAQTRAITKVTAAVAVGDLSKKVSLDVRGESLELTNTVNAMVGELSRFASEVTRVAREVGSEGNLGGQAIVKGVAGSWKDLTDEVNTMSATLTGQVRAVGNVTAAVALGDLSRRIRVDVKGEYRELNDTINAMVDQLDCVVSEVTRVALQVGTEGKLGAHTQVKGVAGSWKSLTSEVDSMAATFTGLVRSTAEVAAAMMRGDFTRSISANAGGEVSALKSLVDELAHHLDESDFAEYTLHNHGIV